MADQTEIERARVFLSDLRENLTSYHQPVPGEPGHCTCGRAFGCTGDAEDLAAIATLAAALAERDALAARVAELEARPQPTAVAVDFHAVSEDDVRTWREAVNAAVGKPPVVLPPTPDEQQAQAERDTRPLIERLAPDDAERLAALIDERDSWRTEVLELRARMAELEGERDADVRAVDALHRATIAFLRLQISKLDLEIKADIRRLEKLPEMSLSRAAETLRRRIADQRFVLADLSRVVDEREAADRIAALDARTTDGGAE